jgi:hypothetical protein
LLRAGERPPAAGNGVTRSSRVSRTSTAGGSYDELENGVSYACGVSGFDSKGNVGELSELRCATPEPVTDFFEAYDRAGGNGGGGFCSFGAPRGTQGFVAAGIVAALLAFRHRRRTGHR